MSPNAEVENAAQIIQFMVAGGKTPDEAVRMLVRQGLSEDVVRCGRAHYEMKVGIITHLKEPAVVVGDRTRNWYGGPSPDSGYWGEFIRNTRASLPSDVADGAIKDIDDATSRILDLAGAPGWETVRTKGLVLGYVQSGKTTNFMGVMAKAADSGYRLFIVLSGITDNLRSQTQQRVDEALLGDHPENWYMLTDLDRDFAVEGNAANLLNDTTKRLIAVVKKNGFRLRRLKDWIDEAGSEVAKGLPIMVIDDEADQASLDVGKNGHISRINGLIGQIISHPKSSYVAYTATPFANLLTEPKRYENLYPEDFIVEMKKPEGYFGPEQLFGRDSLPGEGDGGGSDGLDVIRTIEEHEASMAKPPKGRGAVYSWFPTVTPAMRDAIDWFVLATAARRARSGQDLHSTMLIHTSMLAEAHNRLRQPVDERIASLRESLTVGSSQLDHLRALWETETAAVPAASLGLTPLLWEAVLEQLPRVLQECRTVVDNYTSTDRLYYRKDEPATVIVIGGNTLSRGLTLEGLVSSYFVRAASAYDTLLQMGRWFGYRRGYEDLPRVWMPEELAGWFQDLATVEEEIRREIRAFGPELKPRDVGVRIRTHPSMAITSAAKMRGAVDAALDYNLKREQTILFEHTDAAWLKANIEATRHLLMEATSGAEVDDGYATGRFIVRGVPGERIVKFLEEYRMHPNAVRLRTDLLREYIAQQMKQGGLTSWNVVLLENTQREQAEDLDLGIGRGVRTVERSRLRKYSHYANIKSLVSTLDRIADTGLGKADLPGDIDPDNDISLAKFRQDALGGVGLLCIYPIDKSSQVRNPAAIKVRVEMDAQDHVIGLGIYFPKSVGDPVIRYKSADIKAQIEDDADEFDDIEAADQAADAEDDPDAVAGSLSEAAQ